MQVNTVNNKSKCHSMQLQRKFIKLLQYKDMFNIILCNNAIVDVKDYWQNTEVRNELFQRISLSHKQRATEIRSSD